MPWVKLDDHFPDHEKLANCGDLSPLCGWLYVCGLAFCNRQLTDGHIPKSHIHKLVNFRHIQVVTGGVGKGKDQMVQFTDDIDVDNLAAWLVAVGLWEEDGPDYVVHDYFDYQPSRESVLAERDRLREIGRKGGQSRAKAKLQAKLEAEHEAKPEAKPEAKLNLKPVPVPVPLEDTHTAREATTPILGGQRAHRSHALCGRVCMPAFVYGELVRKRGGDEQAARRYVDEWFTRVTLAMPADVVISEEEPIYWRRRWAADHPPSVPSRPVAVDPPAPRLKSAKQVREEQGIPAPRAVAQ